MPQTMKPPSMIPFERSMLASVKQTEAKIQRDCTQFSIPLYDRYVNKGSVYAANRAVAGLLGKSDNDVLMNARDGD